MLPNFLIIGSQKAGTTSMYEVLRRHPELFLPQKKELNFFYLEKEYEKGINYYENYFKINEEGKIAGEASPGYICKKSSPERIKKHIPNAKLILIVRNPIDRAYSQYWHSRRNLNEGYTFEQAIEKYLNADYWSNSKGYFNRGCYIKYIKHYLNYFDKSQILIVLFDEMKKSPQSFYQKVFDFLNVSPIQIDELELKHNSSTVYNNPIYNFLFSNPAISAKLPKRFKVISRWGKRKPYKYDKMKPETRKRLVEFYKPWNDELAKFLGTDLSSWNQ